ncbi:hypothetical protein BB2000_1284 [Proteus mirabilis BB2000]|nr:hypothetical protein BB2000_1284 [Proteus mirabilis BB2000]
MSVNSFDSEKIVLFYLTKIINPQYLLGALF